MKSMKISVVTAVYNRAETVENAIQSVVAQNYSNIEYLVVDGMSNDGTEASILKHQRHIANYIREPDNGIYDALNKGITYATGDVIGFLHADDQFADESALTAVAEVFDSGDYDAVYGDLVYVSADNPNNIVRYWKSGDYNIHKFRRGWMPPHPTVYVRKLIYEQWGDYRTDLGSAADYECMIRLMVKNKIRVGYAPKVLVKMRVGGTSNVSVKNRMKANRSDRQAWLENGVRPPFGLRLLKPLSKLPQFIRRPPVG